MQSKRGLASLAVAGLLGMACSSGGGGTGAGGTGGPGQGGASAGSSGGAGAGGANSTAGSGGSGAGVAGGSAAGSGGSGGSGGSSAGTAGTAGTAGATGQAGRGGALGTAGTSGGAAAGGGTAGRGGAGGGAGGRGGAAGVAPDGGVASPVTPTKMGNRYRFATGDVVLEIDAAAGARVATLSLGGTHLIVPSGTDPTTWGSVFWTSPRSDWTPQTWPPPVMIDSAMYSGGISGTHVVLNGPTETSLGVSMSKDYAADAATGWIKIAYTINATKAIRAAPWEVSRVPRGGIVFFPSGTSVTPGPLTITQSSGIVWFNDAPMTATSPDGAKLAADGSGGWTAYVLNGNLFLKKFVDQPASAQAAGEGEVDIYPGNGFLEFEVQGPLMSIPASGSLPWSIEWRVVKIPAGVTVAVGSASLVDFVRQQLGPP